MDKYTTKFKEAIDAGWIIVPTSCACGGRYAWMKPRESGAMEMFGCICHNEPFDPPQEKTCENCGLALPNGFCNSIEVNGKGCGVYEKWRPIEEPPRTGARLLRVQDR